MPAKRSATGFDFFEQMLLLQSIKIKRLQFFHAVGF
jgi:hypothetical protein